jgi:hypothetical protein
MVSQAPDHLQVVASGFAKLMGKPVPTPLPQLLFIHTVSALSKSSNFTRARANPAVTCIDLLAAP